MIRLTIPIYSVIRLRSHQIKNDELDVINTTYVVGSKSFRPDIQKPRQTENAVRDI